MKKLLIFLATALLVVFTTSMARGDVVVKKGKTFTAVEDGIFFNMKELGDLKQKLDLGEKNEKLVVEYKALTEHYRNLREIQEMTISEYGKLDQKKNEALTLYKESVEQYRKVIDSVQGMNDKLEKSVANARNGSRWKNRLSFFFGFIAPVLGARAFQQIK